MSPEPATPERPPPPAAGARPEFSLRAVMVGILVAVFIGLMYPYVVLKIGFGPNISVVSAFLGFVAVSLIGRVVAPRGNRFEYNIVQTAGTAAGEMGFMVIVLAAIDLLASKPELGINIHLSTLQIFLWLTLAGGLGVLLAVPLRKHYIDEEQLTFADGTAAGETLVILDTDYKTARRGLWALIAGGGLSFVHTLLSQAWRLFPESLFFGKWGEKLHVGTSWSILSIASGMIVGLRVTLSMALGMVLAWYVAPPLLFGNGLVVVDQVLHPEQVFRANLNWVMWPAVGMMISGGLTALVLKWNLIVKTFKDLKVSSISSTDFPIRWVVIGSVVLATALVVVQKISLDLPIWLSVTAILISLPLMVVGTRVLGETNWAPISAFGNLVQLVFAALAPGSVTVNMLTSGMSGTVAANGEHLMQDYKAGKIIGSNNRYLTYMQLLALPFGAIAVAVIYPILRSQNGIGPDRYGLAPELVGKVTTQGLVAPASVRWAGFAEILSKGVETLQTQRPYALQAFGVALLVGVVLTVLESKTKSVWVPSATSVGLGMLIEAHYVIAMVLGGFIQWVCQKRNAAEEGELNMPLSSGGIVGEAIAVLGITIITFLTKTVAKPGGFFQGAPDAEPLVNPYVWGGIFLVGTAALLAYAHRRKASGAKLSGAGH
ncbi:MAG TPA: OPT/YSL family transporter [Myxococcales bacterium]|nr:OPT/YSL family transporter [Myxococcales bacterium]